MAFCSECGQKITYLLRPRHYHPIFDKETKTCSDKCARVRKSRLQRERREERRRRDPDIVSPK